MRISDLISAQILSLLENSGVAEIQRNELAAFIGCVPSQINYVLESRFTPEQGYIVESRRGGGGYIRITRVSVDHSSAIMHLVNSVGDQLDSMTARIIIDNLLHQGLISPEAAELMNAALSEKCYKRISPLDRDGVRASILKQMLLCVL